MKDPDAVSLGRRGGLKGGPARAAVLTPEQRSEAARNAANARWNAAARQHHQYVEPIEGFCMGFVNLGPRFEGRVRCSRLAVGGDYCRTHAKEAWENRTILLGPPIGAEDV